MTGIVSGAVGFLFMAALAGGAAYFVYRSYAKMTPRGTANHFGLAPNEIARAMWAGEMAIDISTAARVGTAALGLVAGALLGGIGIAGVRAPGVTVLLTSQNRLVLVCERPDGGVNKLYFASPREIRVEHLGPANARVQGGPAHRFAFTGSDGVPLVVHLHESAVPMLSAWVSAA